MLFLRLTIFATLVVAALAGCSCRSSRRHDPNSFVVDTDRDINAKVKGCLVFGPCGRPKTHLDTNVKDSGNTRLSGNLFQALETAGRFSEILKIVGNRYKPEVFCPPRPPSNVDTSGEQLPQFVRRKPGRSSGRYICRPRGRLVADSDSGYNSGSGRGSGYGSEDSGSGSDEYNSGSDDYNSGADDSSYDGDSNGGGSSAAEYVDDVYSGEYGCDKTLGGQGGRRGHHAGCGCNK